MEKPVGSPHAPGVAVSSMGCSSRSAVLFLWALVVGGCTGLDGVRYTLRPSREGDTLSVAMRLTFRSPPPAVSLVGRASTEIADIREPRAFDARGRPVP